jgi:MFS family permease
MPEEARLRILQSSSRTPRFIVAKRSRFMSIRSCGLAPVEQAILVDTFPLEKRAAAFALYSMAIVAAPAVGPPPGGWITDNFSWRWVFFINVPIGLLSLFFQAGWFMTRQNSRRNAARPGGAASSGSTTSVSC